jgi:hypothetical protein
MVGARARSGYLTALRYRTVQYQLLFGSTYRQAEKEYYFHSNQVSILVTYTVILLLGFT